MAEQQIAELTVINTSAACVSYRLIVAGRVVWSNRAHADVPESHAAVKARMKAWAEARGVRIVAPPVRKAG